jgi:hypothetical protein
MNGRTLNYNHFLRACLSSIGRQRLADGDAVRLLLLAQHKSLLGLTAATSVNMEHRAWTDFY